MPDLDNGYPLQIQTQETKEMQLKWIAIRRQEAKSQIVRAKQDIEDLKQGKVVELERKILHAEQTLTELARMEKDVQSK